MPAVIITMLVILLLAAAIIAVVAMGMQGHARDVNPELADAMERTARHLNGEAEPPRGLRVLLDEFDELPSPDLKEIPARIRSFRSARSAASAASATSAASAASADLPEPEPAPSASDGRPTGAAAQVPDVTKDAALEDTVVHARLPRVPRRH